MEINLKLTISILLPAAFMLVLVACGGESQIADTPSPEAKVVAKVEVEPSPGKEPPKPGPTKPSIPTEMAPSATLTYTPTPPAATPTTTPTQVPPTPGRTQIPIQVPSTLTSTPVHQLTSLKAISCSDEGTHIYCLSSELPAPPQNPNVAWGAITGYSPEVFCASDLSIQLCGWQTSSLLAAMIEWGNYGPLEYWVIGTELAAGEDITNVYCGRRVERGDQPGMAGCLGRYSPFFEGYRRIGEEAVASGEPSGNAGLHGAREWGIHFFISSLPVGWTDAFKIPGVEDRKPAFHEYFHAVQHAHIETEDHRKRDQLVGPIWFVEGGAEYMAWAGLLNVYESGVLEKINVEGKDSFSPLNYMEWKIRRGVEKRKSVCPGVAMKDFTYKNTCDKAHYDLGTWAHAYLANKFGPNVLLETFYPNLENWGWEGAFNMAYGMSSADFYREFDKFLEWPLADQLAILPASFHATNQVSPMPTTTVAEYYIDIGYNKPHDQFTQEIVVASDVPEGVVGEWYETQRHLRPGF